MTQTPASPKSPVDSHPAASAQWENRISGYGSIFISDIKANAKNFRTHPDPQMRALLGVLKEVGVVQNVIVNKTTGFLVDGHARVALAIENNQESLPCTFVDITEEEEDFILATLDPIAALARVDRKRLDLLLANLKTQDEAVQNVLTKLAHDNGITFGVATPNTDPEPKFDRAGELRERYNISAGQLWSVGQHRVLCGDSANPANFERLMSNSLLSLMWTDPPYGVNYLGGSKPREAISSDLTQGSDLQALLTQVFKSVDLYSIDSAPFYCMFPFDGPAPHLFREAIVAAQWRLHQTLVWVKDNSNFGRTDYHYRHEPIYYGWMTGTSEPRRQPAGRGHLDKLKPNHSLWYGTDSETTVFEVPRPKISELHSTMKPPELIQRMLRNSSKRGDIVIDPFLGSGSTLVAAQNLGRILYGIEVSPDFCAVVLDRGEQMGLQVRKLSEA